MGARVVRRLAPALLTATRRVHEGVLVGAERAHRVRAVIFGERVDDAPLPQLVLPRHHGAAGGDERVRAALDARDRVALEVLNELWRREGIRMDQDGSDGIRRSQKESEGVRRDQKGSEGIRKDQEGSEGIKKDQKRSGGIIRNQKEVLDECARWDLGCGRSCVRDVGCEVLRGGGMRDAEEM